MTVQAKQVTETQLPILFPPSAPASPHPPLSLSLFLLMGVAVVRYVRVMLTYFMLELSIIIVQRCLHLPCKIDILEDQTPIDP